MRPINEAGQIVPSELVRLAQQAEMAASVYVIPGGVFLQSDNGLVVPPVQPPSAIDNLTQTINGGDVTYEDSTLSIDPTSTLVVQGVLELPGLATIPESAPIVLMANADPLVLPSFGQQIEVQPQAAGLIIQNFPPPPANAAGQIIQVWLRNGGPFAMVIQNNAPLAKGGAAVLTPTGSDVTLGAGESALLTWFPSLGSYAVTSGTAGAIGALTTVAGVGGVVIPALAGGAGLQLAGLAGQSGDLLQFLSSGGAVLARVAAGGQLTLPASTAASAGLNLGSGTAPTSPSNGDVWVDSSGNLKWQGAGSTHSAGGGGGNANNALTQETGTATTTQTQIFTQTNSNGLHGCFTIKNSSGTTSISVIVSATDAFGNSLTNVTLNSISPNGFLSFDLDNPGLLNSNNVFAPLTTFTLSLKTGSGTAAYDAWFSLVG